MKLTQTVKKGGCAAKVPAMILREILDGVKFPPNIPGVQIDGTLFDDAAIFQISDEISLVQTLDFFTPIVDSPREFGAIAAANALSDVYAMGGKPKTCMAILAAPLATMENAIIQEVLQGACHVIQKAGASLVGGHSIDDDTLKFGLSVTGTVHPKMVWSNAGARVGDVLILTKPLGTGTICAGIKKEIYSGQEASEALESMQRLNNITDYLDEKDVSAIHTATDITGFGLFGHGYQLAKASGVTLAMASQSIPTFSKTRSSLEQGLLTKAHRSNAEYTKAYVHFHPAISEIDQLVCFDPQTSGGLLLSVAPSAAAEIITKLSKSFPGVAIIGNVQIQTDAYVTLE
jgi:selenide, water dikinase